ncbi:50S ribosomal protein L25/general stress protein Ctc [Sporosarcina sp. CAU 1771]
MSTTIQASVREIEQQSTLTDLRQRGFVPAVVYGYKTETTSISLDGRDLLKTLRVTGRNGVMKLQIEDKVINVVLNDYQADPLKGDVLHADFLAINMTEELEVEVHVNLVGESVGEKAGGVLQQPNREITIKVKPSDIPESFDVDISAMEIGDSITVADIRENSKYEILSEDDHSLVLISAPRTEEDLEALDAETGDASVEPEVIGGTKEEDE